MHMVSFTRTHNPRIILRQHFFKSKVYLYQHFGIIGFQFYTLNF